MEPEIRKLIQGADWPRITKELAVYTCYRVEITFGGKKDDLVLPVGFSLEAIVQEAIKRFFDGIREWQPKKVELLPFLKGVVKSVVSHLVELKENELADRGKSVEEHFDIDSGNPSLEESLIEKRRRYLITEAHSKLIQTAETNSEYESVALCMMDGIDKSADIAGKTDLEINKVYYLKKRWKKDYENILREIVAQKDL